MKQATWTDKVIWVTGASRGIGRAIAQQFAQLGGRVVIHYQQNQAAAEATLATLAGEGHMLLQADLAAADTLPDITANVIAHMGRIDILVNNAATFANHPIMTTSYEAWQHAWQHTLNTNLLGVANLTFCVVKYMQTQGGGKIINISSRGAFRGEPQAPAYGASKAGLNAMSQSLAQALAPHGIFVYVVAPGFVETDMAAEMLTGPQGDSIRQQSPLGRVAYPDEVAQTVVFLASPGTDFLTGCVIDINGASYLRT